MQTLDTFVANYLVFCCLPVVLYVLLSLPHDTKKHFIVEAVIGGLLALTLAKLGSKLYYDPRPFVVGHFAPSIPHASDNGFPSDHTLLAAFIAFLIFVYNKKWGCFMLIIAAVIGLSRVFAGVHHLTDVIGSFMFAGISIAATHYFKRLYTHSKELGRASTSQHKT